MEFLKLPATHEEAVLTLGLAAAGPTIGKGLAAGVKALRGGKLATLADDAARAGSALRGVANAADAGGAAAKAGSNLGPAHRRTGVTVLGTYDEYVKAGEKIGARYFNIPKAHWDSLSPGEKWAANAKFLDRTVARGDEIVLSSLPSGGKGVTLQREINFLQAKGYTFADGLRLVLRR